MAVTDIPTPLLQASHWPCKAEASIRSPCLTPSLGGGGAGASSPGSSKSHSHPRTQNTCLASGPTSHSTSPRTGAPALHGLHRSPREVWPQRPRTPCPTPSAAPPWKKAMANLFKGETVAACNVFSEPTLTKTNFRNENFRLGENLASQSESIAPTCTVFNFLFVFIRLDLAYNLWPPETPPSGPNLRNLGLGDEARAPRDPQGPSSPLTLAPLCCTTRHTVGFSRSFESGCCPLLQLSSGW